MDPIIENSILQTRRQILLNGARGLGGMALGSMLAQDANAAKASTGTAGQGGYDGVLGQTHFPAKAKRVIYLFFSGGPSHIDQYDFKPEMRKFHGEELPDSIRNGQRITGMTSGQKSFPCNSFR